MPCHGHSQEAQYKKLASWTKGSKDSSYTAFTAVVIFTYISPSFVMIITILAIHAAKSSSLLGTTLALPGDITEHNDKSKFRALPGETP